MRDVIGTSVLAMALLAACANSGLGETDADTDTDAPEGTCPWVGTWTLTTITCGSIEATEWFGPHTGATVDLTHAPAGGCEALMSLSGPSCNRTESWSFPVPLGPGNTVSFAGITTCEPNACLFEPYGTPCAVGALAGVAIVEITVTGTDMSMTVPYTAVGPLTDTVDCPLEVTTDWTSAPTP